MQLTFLGHAAWLVQTSTTTVAMDLIVDPTFRNGTFTICPTRELDLPLLPKLDALVITHRHRDHFDLDTLARLPRTTKILCPDDAIIRKALARLGYLDVELFDDWAHRRVGDLDLIFTPSENRVPENGVLVSDGETSFWNHVDTVIGATTLEIVRDRVGQVDFVSHAYQPMLETNALAALGTTFPVQDYATMLHRARLLAPRAIAPGSNGYRTAGPQSWFNRYKFPVSRERFVRDVAELLPDVRTVVPNAGDVMILRADGLETKRQAAGWVRTPHDDSRELMAFDPGAEKPALVDHNPSRWSDAALRAMTRTILEERAPLACAKKIGRFQPLRMIEAVLELRVVYPNGAVEPWALQLRADGVEVSLGSRGEDTDVVMTVGASTLYDLATGHTRPDIVALSGQYRVWARMYRVVGGRVVPLSELVPATVHSSRVNFPSLLFTLVNSEEDAEARQVDAELDRLLGIDAHANVPLWQRPQPLVPQRRAASAGSLRPTAA